MSAFCTIRSAVLPRIVCSVTPGVSRGTRNPLTCPSATSRAKTASTSAAAAPPIQRLAPSSTQCSPSRRAVLASPRAMSEPWSGSVSANTPVSSNRRILGSSSAATAGSAPRFTTVRNRPDWALYMVAIEASVRASSKVRKPVYSALGAAPAAAISGGSIRSSSTRSGSTSYGNSPRSQYSASSGRTRASRTFRRRPSTDRSASLSCWAKSSGSHGGNGAISRAPRGRPALPIGAAAPRCRS